ncbi:MAG: DnaD domain protein [Lachnospiraceae bacterium]
MEEIKLSSHIITDAVLLPAAFIEQYMPTAPGDYVKVYLYLLRQITSPTAGFSLKYMAKFLNIEENDVMRALSYWEKQSLIQVEVNDFIVTGIHFLAFPTVTKTNIVIQPPAPSAPTSEPPKIMTAAQQTAVSAPAKEENAVPTAKNNRTTALPESKPAKSTSEISYKDIPWDDLSTDDDFQVLIRAAQSYLNTTMKPSDCDRMAYWYILFDRSADIIEYLIEYCVDLGKGNFHYMEKVALNWHEQGLKTLAEVKQYSKNYLPAYRAVANGMGLKERSLNTSESELLKKWVGTYRFPADVIQYACEQTLRAIHTPSFEYADEKLTDWYQNGISTLEQAKASVKQFRSNQAKTNKNSGSKNPQKSTSSNRFLNFEQRDTDYNEYFKDFLEYSENHS